VTPTLSFVVPTAGRPSLRRTLESAAPQILPGDEVVVVGDTCDGPLPRTEAICRDFPFARYLEHAGEDHWWGHPQFEAGQAAARGDWLGAQDDDDIWTPGAFAAMRAAIAHCGAEPRPLLFRFRSYWGGAVFWHTPGPEWVRRGHIGGHCLVTPNLPGKLGDRHVRGIYRYEADFDWIADTLRKWAPVQPLWCDTIIAEQRPR
jgi:glycosyltransferase involved in cell wall biosynthesis